MSIDVTKKGTPVPTRFGTVHVGDIIEARLYEKTESGGTAINTNEGEVVYYEQESRFLIRCEKGLSYNLNFAEKFVIVKKWDKE